MRVCFVTTSYPRYVGDDAGIFVQRLAMALAQQSVQVLIITPHDKLESEHEQHAGIEIVRVPYAGWAKNKLAYGAGVIPNIRRRPWLIFQAPFLLWALIKAALKRADKYDLFHAHWIPSGVVGLAVNFKSKKPFLISIRGEDARLIRHLSFLLLPILRRAQALICVSAEFKMQLERLLAKSSRAPLVQLIPNGIEVGASSDLEQFKLERKIDSKQRYLSFIGSLIPRKRVEILIQALAKLNRPDVSLLLIGRGNDETYMLSLKNLVQELNLKSSVRFEGAVAPNLIGSYLACSSLYLSASEFEGRPNSVLEAMAFGVTPCLSDIAAHREIVSAEHNGVLFKDEEELAQKLSELLTQPEKTKRLSLNAKESVKHLSWQSCAENHIKLYQQVL